MSIITTAVVGNTVLFRASFLDEDGAAMSVTAARISVVQRKVTVDAAMEADDDKFIYRLNTGQFRAEDIAWAIVATNGTSRVAANGTIALTKNSAS